MENHNPDDPSDEGTAPVNELDSSADATPHRRQRRPTNRRGLRVPLELSTEKDTVTEARVSLAPSPSKTPPSLSAFDLPDLTSGEFLHGEATPHPQPNPASQLLASHTGLHPDDLDLDAPTPVPLTSIRPSVHRATTLPPELEVSDHADTTVSIPAPTGSDPETPSSMRIVRRRIRKLGSDDTPSAPPTSTVSTPAPPSDVSTSQRWPSSPPAEAPALALDPSPEIPPSTPPRSVLSRTPSSRPPPPRRERPSIFNAPTIPPEPREGAVVPAVIAPLAPVSQPPPTQPTRSLSASVSPEPDDVELSLDDDLDPQRISDPSLALLDELDVSQPIARPEVSTSAVPRTSLPPPPPPETKAARPPPPPDPRNLKATLPDTRRRRRMWWEDLFNEDYLRVVEHLDSKQLSAEVDWIEHSLGVESGASVIDIACGVGLHAVELAARRFELAALDLSPVMCQRVKDTALARGVSVEVLQTDMAAFDLGERFDAAYCIGTSFGYFDDERNAEVAVRVHNALKPHGTFLLSVVNRDSVIQKQPAMSWFEGEGCVCMEETSFNFITSRLNVKRTMIFDDGRQREMEYSVRLYALHELGQMLHQAGFRILEVSGHRRTPGAFFGPSSRELIILAQKRGPEVVELGTSHSVNDPSEPPPS